MGVTQDANGYRNEGGAVAAVCGISIDITEIKKARDQVNRLSDSIIASQEKGGAVVSRELHDELGQVLTALRLDSAWLRERLRESDAGASLRTQEMCALIGKTIDEVRGMATRLRPGVLDDLGLVDAIDWYTDDFEKRTKVSCVFQHAGVPKMSDRVATAAYRLALGKSNREIAESYHISAKTVDTYRARLLGKLNLKNNAELTRFAIQNGIVEL